MKRYLRNTALLAALSFVTALTVTLTTAGSASAARVRQHEAVVQIHSVGTGQELERFILERSASYTSLADCANRHITVRYGSKGTCVRRVQEWNNTWAPNWHGPRLVVDGNFGAKTQAAVKLVQRQFGLTQDGVVGPNTYDAMLSLQ